MTQFKIGDTVIIVSAEPTWVRGKLGDIGEVTSYRDEGYYIKLKNGSVLYYKEHRLALYNPPEEELPPAPESTMYFNSIRDAGNDQRLIINQSRDYKYHLSLGIVPRGDNTTTLAINLDADAALQLCHDLRRMAMELKRKEKQDA